MTKVHSSVVEGRLVGPTENKHGKDVYVFDGQVLQSGDHVTLVLLPNEIPELAESGWGEDEMVRLCHSEENEPAESGSRWRVYTAGDELRAEAD